MMTSSSNSLPRPKQNPPPTPQLTQTFPVAGASRGIGLAVAQPLHQLSHSVIALSRTKSPVGE
jgi:short-subunit dehydrogenase